MLKLTGLLAALMLFVGNAYAIPIQVDGAFTLTGNLALNGPLATATAITDFDNGEVQTSDGDFGIYTPAGTPVDFMTETFVFSPSTPYASFMEMGGFTFNYLSSAIVHQSNLGVIIAGSVEITGNGFAPTLGEYNISFQGPSAQGRFSFSGSGEATNVSDSGETRVLLSLGLLALGGLAYVSKRK